MRKGQWAHRERKASEIVTRGKYLRYQGYRDGGRRSPGLPMKGSFRCLIDGCYCNGRRNYLVRLDGLV